MATVWVSPFSDQPWRRPMYKVRSEKEIVYDINEALPQPHPIPLWCSHRAYVVLKVICWPHYEAIKCIQGKLSPP